MEAVSHGSLPLQPITYVHTSLPPSSISFFFSSSTHTHIQKRLKKAAKATRHDTPSIFRDKAKLLQEIELGISDLQKRIEEEKQAKKTAHAPSKADEVRMTMMMKIATIVGMSAYTTYILIFSCLLYCKYHKHRRRQQNFKLMQPS